MDAVEEVMKYASEAAKEVIQNKHLCVLVTLNVRKAFNSAPWHRGYGLPRYIREMIRSYLNERNIILPTDGGMQHTSITCDVPQGSILGSTLWNLFYDGLLRVRLLNGISVVGFANDMALVTMNHTTDG